MSENVADAPKSRLSAVEAAAGKEPEELSGPERTMATEWFMSADLEEVASDLIELNVGGPQGSGREKWVEFKIQIVDRDRIREIRKESEIVNRAGESEVQEMEANLRIAAEGLVDPDLSKAENRIVRGQRYLDPADALKARFAHKPGLIDQIAGKIIEVSGYNDKDVREVRAAKN